MNEASLTWHEHTPKSALIASIWSCSVKAVTTRTVLADPCTSLAFVKDGSSAEVVLRGPDTKPRTELLTPGYTCTTIRLRPGVALKGFPAQQFVNSSLDIPANATLRFWFEGLYLQFPTFDTAELLVEHLYNLGCIQYNKHPWIQRASSPRSHARLVKRITGLSPYQLYQLQRMHQALRLLKQGVPVATVASELDFVDQAHLTHASKRLLGHTPKQLLGLPQAP